MPMPTPTSHATLDDKASAASAGSFYLLFEFLLAGNTVSSGYQQIVFARRDKRIQRLPFEVLRKIKNYEAA